MKKKVLIILIILVVLIIIAACLLVFTGKKEVCGPAFLGEGRNTSYCDTSCNMDNDCKYICGCGVINKDEVCDTTGAEVDCVAPGEIKCVEGKCKEVIANVIDGDNWAERVKVSTDKTEYSMREDVTVTVKNSLNKSIWYPLGDYTMDFIFLGNYEDNWSQIPLLPLSPLPPGYTPEITELKSGESVVLKYAPSSWVDEHSLNFAKYKLSFVYKENKDSTENKQADSNEFNIINNYVTLITDKMEYDIGERINITVKNNLKNHTIAFSLMIEKFENNTWETFSYDLPCTCMVLCQPPSISLFPNDIKEYYMWDQKKWIDCQEASEGNYKFRGYFGSGELYSNYSTRFFAYSNVFTIDKTTKYCSNYTYPMAEEERNNCTCPEGKEKFQGYGGAYCATNSQKPCSSHEECPAEEKCISPDGKIWNCTGEYSGCYHNMPENPEVEICVD